MDITLDSPRRRDFSLLRRRARQAYRLGRFEEALALYERAWDWAQLHGCPDDLDRALCGRASVAIELRRGDDLLSGLRAVLMRSANNENCFLAANNIGRAYELQRQHKKAAFYARIARDHARRVSSREWLASAHNLLGNACLAESRVEEAVVEYSAALELVPAAMTTWRALIEQNLGYARATQGDHQTGLRLLWRSLRALRSAGAARYTTAVRVDLAFTYLEAERPQRALLHARRAMAEATGQDDGDALKNSLYLCGEAANRLGLAGEARACFERLQREFFRGNDRLPDFLLTVGVRKMLSLRA
jgi:tetratricopeptide (TPR) repeat protein